MKAFVFRLERVMRWRATQVTLQQARASVASARLAAIEGALEARKVEVRACAGQIRQNAMGTAFQSYGRFVAVAQRDIKDLDGRAVAARKAVALEMNLLNDANRKVQLLENLKEGRQNVWQKEFDREIAAFADEAFLYRANQSGYNRENRRARSSGG